MNSGIARLARQLGALLPFVALGAAKLWLVSAQLRSAMLVSNHDDGLFLRLARSIVAGDWLGPYDQLTLIKGCGYPLWLAANSLLPWSQHLADHLLYLLATGLLVIAVRPRIGPVSAVALFALVLFNPMSFTAQISLRYVRSSVYPALALLVIAGALGLLTGRTGARSRALWGTALGVSTAAFWVTREEGLWMAPALALAFALAWKGRPAAPRQPAAPLAVALAMSLAILGCGTATVALLNRSHYGLLATNELKRPEFRAAMGALQRAEPENHLRYVPVPLATQQRIAEVSPAFRELVPFLAPIPVNNTFRAVLGLADDPRYEGELMAGWFVWAFRRAAARAGHHRSAGEAMAYYARLAAELNGACAAGDLACGPPRASLAPVWTREALGDLPASLWRGVRQLVGFAGFQVRAGPSRGRPESMAALQQFTGDRIERRLRAGQPQPPLEPDARRAILSGLAAVYRRSMRVAAAAAAVAFALILAAPRLRGRARLLGPAAVLLTAIAARLALLAWIDVSSFIGLRPRYLAPLYPLALAFTGLVAAEVAMLLSRRQPSAGS